MRILGLVVAVAAAAPLACRAPAASSPSTPAPIRLVDVYRPETVDHRAPAASPPAATEWRFDAPAAKPFWKAGPGVAGFAVRNGKLAGRVTTPMALLDLEKPASDDRDVVHEVQVRMRASAGTNLSVVLRTADTVNLEEEAGLARLTPWPFNTPLVPGDEIRTYVMRTTASVPMKARHVLIRPTDATGATFEIESVRVVSRREHLAGVASGLGWQGLSEVFRETLVARAPETLRFDLDLPNRPQLELALGTIEDHAVTFRVAVTPAGGAETPVLERTVTTPHRWETATVDLSRFAGRKATVALSLGSEKAGALGFWGTPVVREVRAGSRAAGNPVRRQGVIFIWADTLRRDHLSFYGYKRETAPVLARMASEGTVFEDAIAQASWTMASGPSLLTSLYPTTHTVQTFNDTLPSSATTIAEVYRQAGYSTLSLVSIPFVGKFTNLHQGFEELHEPGSWQTGIVKTAREQVDRLLPWLAAHRDAPFFVLLHIRDPHSPFRPAPPYDTLWADAARVPDHVRDQEAVKRFIKSPLMKRFGMPSRAELVEARIDPDAYVRQEKDWYDGSIRAMDAEIGRLRERLSELGLDKETLIAFVADHGEEFLEHGRMFHQTSVYGELANVPLFLWSPGLVPAGLRVPQTVQNIDLMPTLLELSGLPVPAGAQGRSLVSLYRERGGSWARPAVIEGGSRRREINPGQRNDAWAIVLDGWKLVQQQSTTNPGGVQYELYDRRKDPLDGTDVAAGNPEVVARLSRELEAWRRMATQARLKPDSEAASQMKAEDLERLRALGYVN